jgi:hypothetical protein
MPPKRLKYHRFRFPLPCLFLRLGKSFLSGPRAIQQSELGSRMPFSWNSVGAYCEDSGNDFMRCWTA